MQLPNSEILPVNILSQCFNDTTNSYKFYWFLAILEELNVNKLKDEKYPNRISMPNLAARMLVLVWYPLDYYKLSFGKQDGFKGIAESISAKMKVNNNPNSKDLFEQINARLKENEVIQINKKVLKLLNWVPYRFIRPFFSERLKGEKDYKVNKRIIQLSNDVFKNNTHQTIYRFIGEKKEGIEVDTKWAEYFDVNQEVIRGFIYWNLVKFLQKHNPNVIGLSEKLFKPSKRDFTTAKKFWKIYFGSNKAIKCIYSNKILEGAISIDHFLPWSYAVHDELWNLLPTFKSINSSKNNQLPNLNKYIDSFAYLQFHAFHSVLKQILINKKTPHLLESYTKLFNISIEEIQQLPKRQFEQTIKNTIIPMHQIAQNMGFASNWTYQP